MTKKMVHKLVSHVCIQRASQTSLIAVSTLLYCLVIVKGALATALNAGEGAAKYRRAFVWTYYGYNGRINLDMVLLYIKLFIVTSRCA